MKNAAPDSAALIGTVIGGKYHVDRLIGRGGMGSVYEATNTAIGKRVALKFLDPSADHDAVMRFEREARAASAVESEHIVQIFDSGATADGRSYLVMELLRGEDLRQLLRREGRMELSQAVHVIAQSLRALMRAHEAGIVHRDLKPDNIFLTRRDDDGLFAKLLDFGISKVQELQSSVNTLTRKGTVLGTAFYMSPEQAQAFEDIDGRADLYSLGAIFFELLTGEPPHQANSYEAVLVRACTHDAPDVRDLAPDVPEPVAAVVARALARDRGARFASAEEFYEALAAACPELLAAPPPVVSRPSGSARSGPGSGGSRPEWASATSGGTTLQSHAGGPRQARRTLLTAVAVGVGAFGFTAAFLALRSGSDSNPESPVGAAAGDERSIPAAASAAPRPADPTVVPGPPASAEPSTSAGAELPSASADEGPPAPASSGSRVPARPRSGAAAAPAPSKPPGAQEKPSSGVASGLELRTEEP